VNIHDLYVLKDKKIGQGGYGTVHRAKHRVSGCKRAVKVLSLRSDKFVQKCKKEVAVMKQLDHPNVVKLVETFEDEKAAYLVMELCEGGELLSRVMKERVFPERTASSVIRQVLRGVQYLHSHDIAHRDLKPENMLFLNGSPLQDPTNVLKIIDFGLSRRCGHKQLMKTQAGTPQFIAPQVLMSKGYDRLCDIWSVGVVAYLLLCGNPPFVGSTEQELLQNVKKGRYEFKQADWAWNSEESKNFVSSLLTVSPKERPTAAKALSSKWINCWLTPVEPPFLPCNVIENLRKFKEQDEFSKAARNVIAGLLDDSKVSKLRSEFMKLDVDGDGLLTHEELHGAVRHSVDEDELGEILAGADVNGDGVIGYTEFLAAAISKSQCLDKKINLNAFNLMDWDGDGKISRRDVALTMHTRTSRSESTDSPRFSEALTFNGGTSMCFQEFQAMVSAEPQVQGDLVGAVP
jgi:calcium-dependent protein kinase